MNLNLDSVKSSKAATKPAIQKTGVGFRYDKHMNHTEINLISLHLLAERDRLLEAIESVRLSGTVAPTFCWLVESSETKGARTYRYIKLITERPGRPLTSKSLGKPGSEKHRVWQVAIQRREIIAELEQQRKMLEALIKRQKFASVLLAAGE
jgi:hypothetical protein